MEYNKNKLITDDGANLVAQSLQEGKKVNFDSFIITDTPLPSDRQLSAMTIDNFKNIRKYPITNLKKGKNSVQPEAQLDNNGLTEDYAIYAVGLLANISESNNVLFGITQNSEGTPAMLTKQTSTPYFITYDMGITVTNPDNYQATITPAGYVDQTTFNNEIENIHTDIKNIDLSGAVKQANSYTDEQLKDYTSTADLNKELNGKQPLGNYASPDDVSNAESRANSHSDSNRDNLQEQINGKQDAGSYLTTDEFNKYDLSINDGKLMYQGLPIITAVKPSNVSINILNNYGNPYINYEIKCDSGGASIDNYQILYKSNDDNDFNEINAASSTGNINNLIGGKTYELKVNATNKAGTSDYSEIIKYFTFDISDLDDTISFNDISDNYIQTNLNVNTTYGRPYEGYKLKVYLGQSLGMRYGMDFNLLKNAPQGKPSTDTNGYLYILEEKIIPFPTQNIPNIFWSSQFAHNHGGFFAYVGAEVIDNNGNSLGWHTSVLTI